MMRTIVASFVIVLSTLTSFGRASLLGIELDEAGQELLNEYLSLDERRYLAEVHGYPDAIEIDLIDGKKHHARGRQHHQEPRVLYQIGVINFFYYKIVYRVCI